MKNVSLRMKACDTNDGLVILALVILHRTGPDDSSSYRFW